MTTTREFLEAVWPDQGPYCIARPWTPPNGTKPVYVQRAFDNMDDVITYVMSERNGVDLFFAVHTLKVARQLNPATNKMKTYRTHENMKEARAFFFDLDVGEEAWKYKDQAQALEGLQRFLFNVPLPDPFVTSSGNGLHVYWTIEDPIPSNDWREYADKLHWLAQRHGLRADPSRTTDQSSVLRVANTLNFKEPGNPRKVLVLHSGQRVPTATFKTLIDTLVGTEYTPVGYLAPNPDSIDVGAGITWDGRITPPDEIAEVCEYVREFRDKQGQVSEPYWHVMIGLLKYAEDGVNICHQWSSGHPTYSFTETQNKIDLWTTAPPSCDKIKTNCAGDACSRCPAASLGHNPMVIANKTWTQRATPAPALSLANVQATLGKITTLVDPPYPYERRSIGIIRKLKPSDDPDPNKKLRFVRISEYDMFPIQQFDGIEASSGFSRWAVTLPLIGQKIVEIQNSAFDVRHLHEALLNVGIIIDGKLTTEVRDFMLAYLRSLQRASMANKQYDYMGWEVSANKDEAPQSFILHGHKIDVGSGALTPCAMSKTMGGVKEFMCRAGSFSKQVELLKFYAHQKYIPHQIAILASMSTPWYKFTNQHGVIINMSGDSGAGKSYALYTAAAIWGHPKKYPVSGIPGSSTRNGREDRSMMLANLPFMIDEITLMTPDDARSLVMGDTQPGAGPKQDRDRSVKRMRNGEKANMLITSGNSSLHQVINTSNVAGQAGTMRVFEMHLHKRDLVHQKWEADTYMRELSRNYGWIGEELLVQLLPHNEMIERRIIKEMARLDTLLRIDASERFWASPLAVIMVIGRIAYKLGFHHFDMQAIEDWLLTTQMPFLRGRVDSELSRKDPTSIIMDYLEAIHGNTVRIEQDEHGVVSGIVRVPDVDLRAHFDITNQEIWVRSEPFRKHCEREGHPCSVVMSELVSKGVVTANHVKKTLGLGTSYAKGRVTCFVVDLKHQDIKSLSPVVAKDDFDPRVVPFKKKV